MRKNRRLLLYILVIMLLLSAVMLTSCSSSVEDLDEYIGDDGGVSNLTIVGKLIQWMHGIFGNFGLTVIVFTIALKVCMLPLDYWQRVSMRKSSAKMQAIQPLMDEIDKHYGNNPQRAQAEKQKIYKQQSISTLASCLPMIVTMLVFIFMFQGLTNYATFKDITNYDELYTYYNDCYSEIYDDAIANGMSTTEANTLAVTVASEGGTYGGETYDGIAVYYTENIKESFLWIDSVWQPDTWTSIMPDYADFTSSVTLSGTAPESTYNLIREQVLTTASRSDTGTWNGLMILPLCSVGLSFLSIFVSQKTEKKKGQPDAAAANPQQAMSQKSMMIMMPLMMAFFGFMYTGAFAIYMVCNYTISILSTIALKKPIDKAVERAIAKVEDTKSASKANYMR